MRHNPNCRMDDDLPNLGMLIQDLWEDSVALRKTVNRLDDALEKLHVGLTTLADKIPDARP